jgi:hypothetical protein
VDEEQTIGVGPTDELSLRVSVASLARVVFTIPADEQTHLALERKATLLPADGRVTVKAQPFGGALRIHNMYPLKERIGDFHFDSQRSRSEMDFRIFIRPDAWGAVSEFCLEQFRSPDSTVLETGPERELVEEFGDTLGANLRPDQYRCNSLWTILENVPVPTGNVHSKDQPTVRIYHIFDVRITDSDLVDAMILNSHGSDSELDDLAHENARTGKKGWANAMLVLPMEPLISFYQALPEEQRNLPAVYEGFHMEPNVTALLDSALAPKYQLV